MGQRYSGKKAHTVTSVTLTKNNEIFTISFECNLCVFFIEYKFKI